MQMTKNLMDCTAEYMGSDTWVLWHIEEGLSGVRRHDFAITEEDRQTLLFPLSPITATLEDGVGENMGDGFWMLCRMEEVDGELLRHTIAVSFGDLELLAAEAFRPLELSSLAVAREGSPCGASQ